MFSQGTINDSDHSTLWIEWRKLFFFHGKLRLRGLTTLPNATHLTDYVYSGVFFPLQVSSGTNDYSFVTAGFLLLLALAIFSWLSWPHLYILLLILADNQAWVTLNNKVPMYSQVFSLMVLMRHLVRPVLDVSRVSFWNKRFFHLFLLRSYYVKT